MSDHPYKAHVFICTNQRPPGAPRECCAAKNSEKLRNAVKEGAKKFGPAVRINAAGCLDRCEKGIVAVIYPKGEWLTNLTENDAEKVLAAIEKQL